MRALPPQERQAAAPQPGALAPGAIVGGRGEPRPSAEPAERFVAVVFTHKEQAVASRAYAELRGRYGRVLARHQGEIQPVDLGDKGVWHRLVLLPAGSRQDADGVCDQPKSAGRDRCWVKAY